MLHTTAGNNVVSRRRVLEGSAALAGSAWNPIERLTAAHRLVGSTVPPDFPRSIELYRQVYENWDGAVRTDALWTCVPRTPDDVVRVANWAHTHRYRVRARGYRHSWAPLTVTPGTTPAARVVLVDTTRHLTSTQIESPGAVRVQTGASMEALLTFCEHNGYGVTAVPAPGSVTVGGVLAIDGHGSAVPARGETRIPGHSYGSVSNLVTSLSAVVWDRAAGRYAERAFGRGDPECKAFLAHLGRAFLTEVTLRVGADYNLRCVSHVDIPASELFAPPGRGASRTLADLVDSAGRVALVWFAFTSHPWVQVWSIAPRRPLTSRPVSSPYNYPFTDNLPEPVTDLAAGIVKGAPGLGPTYGQLQYAAAVAGLTGTLATDMWGPSKNFLLYVKPTTMRVAAGSYAVLTRRGSLQRVVSEFAASYQSLLHAYRARGLFPINGGVEIRVTGLDQASDVDVPDAEPPALSAVRPREDHPEWDIAVWLDVLTFPDTPGSHAFYRQLEQFLHRTYTGPYATGRVEWSKRWAHTSSGPWLDRTVLTERVPDSFRQGPNPTWDWAVSTLNAYDPHRVFSNPFLDALLR